MTWKDYFEKKGIDINAEMGNDFIQDNNSNVVKNEDNILNVGEDKKNVVSIEGKEPVDSLLKTISDLTEQVKVLKDANLDLALYGNTKTRETTIEEDIAELFKDESED